MELSNAQKREYVRRLLFSRMRILVKNGFYGLLLMHTGFALDDGISTACTDGGKICFSPKFLREISDSELDFVMMHEILHIALKHCLRTGDRDPLLFNIACDIVVNSNILKSNGMDLSSITLKNFGTSMHLTPSGDEGYMYSAEEVYKMLLTHASTIPRRKISGASGQGGAGRRGNGSPSDGDGGGYGQNTWDDHSRWGKRDDDAQLWDNWDKYVRDAAEAISIQKSNGGRGDIPLGAKRILEQMRRSALDWRTLLADFVQEDVTDYSFSPPDKRYDGGDFFLPDLNLGGDTIKDVAFMVDASGSVSDDELTAAFGEIKGAIEQFDGRLRGYVAFFDAKVYDPARFDSVEELLAVKPKGGGGTDFEAVFDYISKSPMLENVSSIVILTDGWAPFPMEEKARGVPVLWIINNEFVNPPWGKTARLDASKL